MAAHRIVKTRKPNALLGFAELCVIVFVFIIIGLLLV